MPNPSPLISVMIKAARAAESGLIRDFGEVESLKVSRKGPADFVSRADRRSEEIIFNELSKARPGYSFLMEERGDVVGTDKTHRFIVDPLDGTLNFLHSIPHFAISIALEREGELVAGVVHSVMSGETFWAEKGKGAWLGQQRLRVSKVRAFEDAVMATGVPFIGRKGHNQFIKEMDALAPKIAGIRRFGAAALDLAWVAAGRYEGFWERHLAPWDIAAGIVLIREAGGIVGALDDADLLASGSILAGNPAIYERSVTLFKRLK